MLEISENLFRGVLNMGITATYTILLVLLVRMVLRKAPKIYSYLLWFAVLFRLLCPIALPSPVSFLNLLDFQGSQVQMTYIPRDIGFHAHPTVNTGIPFLSERIGEWLPAATPAVSANPTQIWGFIACTIWTMGVTGFVIYVLISAIRLHHLTAAAVSVGPGVYEVEGLHSPFARGILSNGLFGTSFLQARIYLPMSLNAEKRRLILLHERVHLRRLDPLVKSLFFVALALHWYNLLVWVAFFVMVKDMEMSCDEAVLCQMKETEKYTEKGVEHNGCTENSASLYSETLLHMAAAEAGLKKLSPLGPLAFGESSVASRIKNVLRFRVFSKRMRMVLGVLCAAFLLICCSNPAGNGGSSLNGRLNYYWEKLTGDSAQNEIDMLWEHRTPYIGDNSAVGNLLGSLQVPKEWGITSDGMELFTSERPYMLKIRYRSTEVLSNRIEEDNWIYENAAILFALIDNADVITTQITFADGEVRSYTANRAGISVDLYDDVNHEWKLESKDELNEFLQLARSTTYWGTNPVPLEKFALLYAKVISTDGSLLVKGLDNAAMGYPVDSEVRYYVYDSRCLILDENGERINASELQAGDILNIYFDGMIAETSPCQINRTYYIQKAAE